MVSGLNAMDKMPMYEMLLIYGVGVLGLGRAFSMLWLCVVELHLGRGIKPFGTDILLFSPFLLYRCEGWTASLVEHLTASEFSPGSTSYDLGGQPIGAPLFSPALCPVQSHFVIGILSQDPVLLVSKWFNNFSNKQVVSTCNLRR